MDDSPQMITVEAAAIRLSIGRNLAYSLARTGKLPGVRRLGRRLVVSRVQLEKYIDGTEPAQEPAVPAGS